MQSLDRVVAGLSCREVLALLSDFLDGELPDADVAAVRAHLAGCRTCERFGGEVADALALLRGTLASPEPLDAAVAGRLAARMARER